MDEATYLNAMASMSDGQSSSMYGRAWNWLVGLDAETVTQSQPVFCSVSSRSVEAEKYKTHSVTAEPFATDVAAGALGPIAWGEAFTACQR